MLQISLKHGHRRVWLTQTAAQSLPVQGHKMQVCWSIKDNPFKRLQYILKSQCLGKTGSETSKIVPFHSSSSPLFGWSSILWCARLFSSSRSFHWTEPKKRSTWSLSGIQMRLETRVRSWFAHCSTHYPVPLSVIAGMWTASVNWLTIADRQTQIYPLPSLPPDNEQVPRQRHVG